MCLVIYIPKKIYELAEGLLCGWLGVALLLIGLNAVNDAWDYTEYEMLITADASSVGIYSHVQAAFVEVQNAPNMSPWTNAREGWSAVQERTEVRRAREEDVVPRTQRQEERLPVRVTSDGSDSIPRTAVSTLRPTATCVQAERRWHLSQAANLQRVYQDLPDVSQGRLHPGQGECHGSGPAVLSNTLGGRLEERPELPDAGRRRPASSPSDIILRSQPKEKLDGRRARVTTRMTGYPGGLSRSRTKDTTEESCWATKVRCRAHERSGGCAPPARVVLSLFLFSWTQKEC
ncbi:hypothetical protein PHYPSEUDO_015307 [Phytophthora pseudosyringae]|uniref:Uncharacterized protein n=1 Tax=Phytophthora pseudosyringae TaxID=221518 RepID=A0A8T1V858_9STRA|nr:hypothetical protein PHYPSEUDO_015307 [Phytophthora pseudosyringae]